MYKKIRDDISEAMKAKNAVVVDTLRLLVDTVQKRMLVSGAPKEITDDLVIDCINKGIKQREESVEAYKKGNRDDLVQKELAELYILKKYRPAQLSEDEIKVMVKEILSELPAPVIMGVAMKTVMAKLKGKADGSLVSRLVKELMTKQP